MDDKTKIVTIVLVLCIVSQCVSFVAIERIVGLMLESQQNVKVIVVPQDAPILNETIVEEIEETTDASQVTSTVSDQTISENVLPKSPILFNPYTTSDNEASWFEIGGYEETLDYNKTSGILTKSSGVNYFYGQKETYYNLPMGKVVENAHNRGLEGEYWEREDGAKMFGDYVIIAAHQGVHPYGSIVETSLGSAIVLDTGDFAKNNPTQVDIAVTW